MLRVINYPHPTLRRTAKALQLVDAELRTLVREMFDLMYSKEHRGVGLAANQVDLPYRLFVVNLSSDPDLKDEEHVFINPVLSHPKGSSEQEEGCLSLPGLFAEVRRPEAIRVNAYDLAGREIVYDLDDLFGRVVQHETDHLNGVLFIDRLTSTAEAAVREKLVEFEEEFASRRQRGEIPSDEQISARLAELEASRT
ncbi:MAG TPA: peptide deformylase [Pirellulales bacterium]|nr:peptide deformylase [Pirellulales bacterium]